MTTSSRQPSGQGSALASLDEAIRGLNLAREAAGVVPVKAALESASILLETVRGSMAHKPAYVELGLSYAGVCEDLGQRVNRSQADTLSQPVLKAVEKLAMTAVEVHKNIIERDKRNVLFRVLGRNKDKKMMNTWLADLIEILRVFNTGLGPNAPAATSDIPPDPADAQTPTPGIPAEPVVPAAPGVSEVDTIARKVPDDTAGTNNVEPDTHRDEDRNDSNQGILERHEASRGVNSVENRKATEEAELFRENGRDVRIAGPHKHTQELLRDQINLQSQTETQVPSDEEEQLREAIALSLEPPTAVGEAGGSQFPQNPLGPKGKGKENADNQRRTMNTDTEGFEKFAKDCQEMLDSWTQQRAILAATGGDVSGDEEAYKATKNYFELLKSYPGGPTTDFEVFQLNKARDEFLALAGNGDEDEQLDRAIAESLATAPAADEVEDEISPEALVRLDSRPVVIRPSNPKLVHVSQLWQALFHVPQVRYQISQYSRPSSPENATGADRSIGGTEGQVWAVHELFEFMELEGLAVVTGEPSMEQFPHRPWEGISPREDVESAYKDFAERVEVCLNGGVATRRPDWPRLFHSRINDGTSRERAAFDAKNDFSFISVEYNDEDDSSDLVGCLTSQGFPGFGKQRSPNRDRATTGERVTIETADVIAFALAREYQALPSCSDSTARISQERRKFSFPESFYLDRFAATNRGLILEAKVAEDVERSAADEGSTEEPQPEKYDLRAVLMHDGQKGRTHVYSYLRKDDAWWKMVDYTATQVPLEEVLNDKNGLHLEAGPFFLIYSRSLSGPPPSEPPETSQSTSVPNPVLLESDSESLYAD